MDKETHGSGQSEVQEAEPEIIATGDAILISRAIERLAGAIERIADKIGELNPGGADDDENPPETYLDGTRRSK